MNKLAAGMAALASMFLGPDITAQGGRGRDQRWMYRRVGNRWRAVYVDRSRYADLRKASVPGGRRRAGKKREAARATV